MKIIDFMKHKKSMLIFSALIIVASIIGVATKGFNLSIDFNGGTVTEIAFKKSVETDSIKSILSGKFKEVNVIHYGNSKNIVVETPVSENFDNVGLEILELVNEVYPDSKIVRTEYVGPKVGEELKTNGLLAMLLVILGILAYISFCFEFKFAVGAVIALLHDITITFGLISLFNINLDLTVLAAVLAILGYSLNDTIIVYDRIRENINAQSEGHIVSILNKSINDTFSRTIMTSLTTSVTLLSLLIFGGESLSSFSIVLLFGIFIGTYSSVYIASSLLWILNISKNKVRKEKVNTESGVI